MKSSSESSISKCEDFADHFRSKIDDIRSLLSKDQNINFITTEPLFLHEDTLEKFALVDAEMLTKVSSQLKPATCMLDPIPTSFFKTFYRSFKDDLLNIVNFSLQMGVFPTAFKTAAVKTF